MTEDPSCNNSSSVFASMKKKLEEESANSTTEQLIQDANAEESKTDSEMKKHCVFKS